MNEKYINKGACDASVESHGTVRTMGRQGSVSYQYRVPGAAVCLKEGCCLFRHWRILPAHLTNIYRQTTPSNFWAQSDGIDNICETLGR